MASRARDLRKAVLDSPVSLLPLVETDPGKAREVLVSAMLVPPRPRSWEIIDRRDMLGITDAPHWHGPVPERGPFLAFFRTGPDEALEAVIETTEHATGQWKDLGGQDRHAAEIFEIYRDGQWVELVGDSEVLQWHRGNTFVPSVLASALMALERHLYDMVDADEDVCPIAERLLHSDSLALVGLLVSLACYKPDLIRSCLKPLTTSAGILVADKIYKGQSPHTDLFVPSIGEAMFAERIREWHSMPHRQRELWWLVMSDVLVGGELVDDLAAAREHWRATDGTRWRHVLGWMDPANWEVNELEDGRREIGYVAPPDLRDELDESNQDVASAGFWLAGPYKWRQAIDQQAEVSDEELEQLWDEWHQTLETVPPDREIPVGIRSRADIEAGIAAFFVICGHQWLTTDDDKRTWCRNALLAPFADPPPTHEFDSASANSDDKWDGFAADAVPILLADSPDDRDLRVAVANLTVHPHRQTVAKVFSAVTAQPGLRDDLRRLERVALQWARFAAWKHEKRHREQLATYRDDFGEELPALEDLPDLTEPTRGVIQGFVSSELPPELPSLRQFIAETPAAISRGGVRGRPHFMAAVELAYFFVAFRHLLVLPEDLDEQERQLRLNFARELASEYAEGLQTDVDEEVDGRPYEIDWAVLDALSSIVASTPLEESRGIWQPLLAPGIPADDWIEIFLRGIWRAALSAPAPPAQFVDLVKEMLQFALGSDAWTPRSGWPRDIETAIVGLDPYTVREFQDHHSPLIDALQPEWGEWVAARTTSYIYARNVAAFLKKAAARPVLADGLGWLAAREQDSEQVDDRLDQDLGELLNHLAANEPDLFRRQDALGEHLRTILGALAGRQRPIALELTARLG